MKYRWFYLYVFVSTSCHLPWTQVKILTWDSLQVCAYFELKPYLHLLWMATVNKIRMPCCSLEVQEDNNVFSSDDSCELFYCLWKHLCNLRFIKFRIQWIPCWYHCQLILFPSVLSSINICIFALLQISIYWGMDLKRSRIHCLVFCAGIIPLSAYQFC